VGWIRASVVVMTTLTTVVACGSDSRSDDGEIVASVDFEVTPPEIALGDVSCGTTKTSEITITNRGGATLGYSVALPDGSPFVLKAEKTGTLGSGAKATLPIDLAPGAPGDLEDIATVDVNGIIQQVVLRARGVGALLVPEPGLVDFGEVRFDRTFTSELVLRNTGNAPALVEGFEGGGDAMAIGPGGVTVAPGGTGPFTATIGAGAVTGAATTASLVPNLAASTPHCGPRPTVHVAALRVNTEVTLSVADFGAQGCGTGGGATRDVLITNYANQAITYTAALPSPTVFTISGGAQGTVPAANAQTASVAKVTIAMGATGSVLGVHEEALTLQISPLAPPSGGTRTTKVRLDVRGALIDATPMSADFSSDGKKADNEKFTFTNKGNEPITLRYAIDQRPTTFNAWRLDAATHALAAGTSRELTVYFQPSRDSDAPDQYGATLKVARDSSSSTAVCSSLPEPKLEGERK
jgi:hypothetical protein